MENSENISIIIREFNEIVQRVNNMNELKNYINNYINDYPNVINIFGNFIPNKIINKLYDILSSIDIEESDIFIKFKNALKNYVNNNENANISSEFFKIINVISQKSKNYNNFKENFKLYINQSYLSIFNTNLSNQDTSIQLSYLKINKFSRINGNSASHITNREITLNDKVYNLYPVLLLNKDIINNLIVENKIGEGSFGIVYSLSNNEIFKIIPFKDERSYKSELKGILFNYLLTKYLELPEKRNLLKYICKLYEFGYINDKSRKNLYCIMEKGNNELLDFLKKIQRYSVTDKIKFIIKLFKECCIALKIIHDLGFIYLDIKPENFLINFRNENDFNIKIIDFGFISKIGDKISLVGTHLFMNTLFVQKTYTNVSSKTEGLITYDIFSLGCLLVDIIFNIDEKYFNSYFPFIETAKRKSNIIRNKKIYTIEKFDSNIKIIMSRISFNFNMYKPIIKELIDRMVNPNQQSRFQSIDEIISYIDSNFSEYF